MQLALKRAALLAAGFLFFASASARAETVDVKGQDPANDKPAVTFKRYENRYWLADIWEPGGQGRALAIGR